METVNERFTTGGTGPEGQPDTVDETASAPAETVETPAHNASKADWVTFAVLQGADEDEAAALTKQELIDTYGG